MSTGCRRVEENLIDFIEKRIPESLRKEINQHLDDCPECKRLVQQFDQVWSDFADFANRQKTTPSPSFWPGLLDKIQGHEKLQRPGNKLLWVLKGSLRPIAAALILLSGIYFGYDLGSVPQKMGPLMQTTDMDANAAEEVFFDQYFQDFQDFPQGSVADFYVSPGIQQQDKTP